MSDSQDEVELEVDCSSEDDSSECSCLQDGGLGRESLGARLQGLGGGGSPVVRPHRALPAPLPRFPWPHWTW